MTYDARLAVLKEQQAWVDAALDALCFSYRNFPYVYAAVQRGILVKEHCPHPWCHGIVDVLNRAYGNVHVHYRMPDEGDPAKEKL